MEGILQLPLSHKVAYPITERDYNLEKAILKKFECPVCLGVCRPPIMMCIYSHVLCYHCWERCNTCPTCREDKSITRAFTLERLHRLLSFQCKYEGCTFTGSAFHINVHEYLCQYYPLNCPLKIEHQCPWTGTMSSVLQHLLSHHRDNVYLEPSGYFTAIDVARSRRKEYTIVFWLHGRMFKFQWFFDTRISRKVEFGMVAIGNANPIVIFDYAVTFSRQFPIIGRNRGSPGLKTIANQVKRSLLDASNVNLHPDSVRKIVNFEMDYEEMLTYCKNGSMVYQVGIEVSRLAKCREQIEVEYRD